MNKILRHIFSHTHHPAHLDELRKSPVDRRPDWGNVIPEIDRSQCTLRDAFGGELEPGIDILVGAGSAEAVEAELLMRVFLPSLDPLLVVCGSMSRVGGDNYHGAHDLNRQDWNAIGENRHPIRLVLGIEHLPAGQGYNTGNDLVLLFQVDGSVDTNADLGTSRDQRDSRALGLDRDVSSLDGVLDGRIFKLREVLPGQSNDRWGVL